MKYPHRLTRGASRRLVLIGPYDPELIEKIKALPRRWRTWNPILQAWMLADEAEQAVLDMIARHYMTPEQHEMWRVRQRLAWCEQRLAELRAEKKAAIRKDWGL